MPFFVTRSREIARVTCLRAFAGRDSIQSVVFDATTLTADANGRFFIPIGSFLTPSVANDVTKVKIFQNLGTNQNDVQTVSISGVPTGGTFTLSWNGQTTAPIAFNASAATVQAALQALSNVGAGNITCTGGALPGAAVVATFAALLGNAPQPVMTANSAGLTGGTSPTASVAHTTPGTTAEHIVGVFDGPDRDFFGSAAADDEPIPMYFHACVFDISKLQNWNSFGVQAKAALPNCDWY